MQLTEFLPIYPVVPPRSPGLVVEGLRAYQDNYIWCIHDGRNVVVVDPGEADPVSRYLQERNLTLGAVLLTHHHADHTGGCAELSRRYRAPIYGPQRERIREVTQVLDGTGSLKLEHPELEFRVLEIPGHTQGHLGYFVPGEPPWLFCGDTLFGGGCGRVFDSTALQLQQSLSKIAQLPASTLIYCAHEYTQANLRFAREVDPENLELLAREQEVQDLRKRGLATVPSLLAVELNTNPFLRCALPAIRTVVQQRCKPENDSEGAIFSALRAWKNGY